MWQTASRTIREPSPASELSNLGDALLTALGDHVGGTEFVAEAGARLVA
jgi:hypothetical protein